MKESLFLIKAAWSRVSSDTIANCWGHCDILPGSKSISDFKNLIMLEVSNSLNDLSKKWDKVVVSNCKLSVE